MTAESDVAAHVITALAGVPWLLTTSNCRPGPVMKVSERQSLPGAVPAECVFANGTGGFNPVAFVDGGSGRKDERLTIQLWVRSNPKDYSGGLALAVAVHGAVEMNPPAGYYESRVTAPEPIHVREDEQHHHEWTINVTLRRCA